MWRAVKHWYRLTREAKSPSLEIFKVWQGTGLINLLQLMVLEQGLDQTISRSACQLQIFFHTVTLWLYLPATLRHCISAVCLPTLIHLQSKPPCCGQKMSSTALWGTGLESTLTLGRSARCPAGHGREEASFPFHAFLYVPCSFLVPTARAGRPGSGRRWCPGLCTAAALQLCHLPPHTVSEQHMWLQMIMASAVPTTGFLPWEIIVTGKL